MLLYISEKVISTSWLILSVSEAKSSATLVLQQGTTWWGREGMYRKKDKLTCQRLHPKSTAEPVRASEDYIVIISE